MQDFAHGCFLRRILSAAVFCVLVAVPAAAVPAFFAPDRINLAQLLPPPPADESDTTRAELGVLHRIETTRTPQRLAQAEADGRNETVTLFDDVLGPDFDIARLPATAKLFRDVADTAAAFAESAKDEFHRTRPYALDPSLDACDPLMNMLKGSDTSYPSGHATIGYAMAVVLAALMPDKAPAIAARAADFAQSRLVCAVHYPSDTEAGRILGTAIGGKLLQSDAFKPEFDAAQAELVAAHLARPDAGAPAKADVAGTHRN